jgi:putative ABC transport system substrate-binding protein
MRRAAAFFLSLLSVSSAGGPAVAGAQPAQRVYRVGMLGEYPPPRMSPSAAAYYENLRTGLREHGYVEGRNLVLEFRWTEGNVERLPSLAAELARLPLDAILAGSTRSALAFKAATDRVPIVFIGIVDPVGSGLVQSLARPGGNVTGVSWDVTPETSAKLLVFLKEIAPSVSRATVLWQSTFPAAPLLLQATQSAARTLGVALHPHDMIRADDYTDAFATIARERAEGLVVLPSSIGWNRPRPLLDFAAQRRLPAAYYTRELVDQGGSSPTGRTSPR